MTKDQFERESNYRLAFSIFRQLYARGFLTAEQLVSAREKLMERFNPPIAVLPDMLESPV